MSDDFKTLAAQLRDLQDAAKAQVQGVLARAEEAGLDPAGLRRFVSWKRKDEAKRAQQEAIDQQCRYLAGERDTPAQLPIGCELAQALNLYRRDFTVRQVAEELRISTGKAGKLRQLSRMFDVHVHATVDKAPSHDPETGEITTAGLDTPPVGSSELSEGHSSAAPDSDADVARFAPHLDEPRDTATQGEKSTAERLDLAQTEVQEFERPCGCKTCVAAWAVKRREEGASMMDTLRGPQIPGWRYACEICGNKRCPHHTDHRLACTGSNEPGQPGSSWENYPPPTPSAGAVAEAQPERVARQDDGLDIPPFLRRQRASA